jgi:hypothetical protein
MTKTKYNSSSETTPAFTDLPPIPEFNMLGKLEEAAGFPS